MQARRLVVCALVGLVVGAPALSAGSRRAVPADTVVHLYHDFAWEAVIVDPTDNSDSLFYAPANVLRRYFDDVLVKLWLKDRNCGYAICRLDFTPIWNGQDPLNDSVQIKPSSDRQVVQVKVSYPNGDTELTYSLSRTARGWRINDIRSPRWSLVEILSKPLE